MAPSGGGGVRRHVALVAAGMLVGALLAAADGATHPLHSLNVVGSPVQAVEAEHPAPVYVPPTPFRSGQVVTVRAASAFEALETDLNAAIAGSGAQVGVVLTEMSGRVRRTLAINPDESFTAASTYKLALLMAEAQLIAEGRAAAGDQVCYEPDDWEDGWFTDYGPGSCYSRQDLAARVGEFSDNTAAHMLVRDMGGPDALNAYAHANGAANSTFWIPNTTTPGDLAGLWVNEAGGLLGGRAAQAWLYPLLTHTETENGIPAGLPPGATVVHKTGSLDATVLDAAYVQAAGRAYVLVICVSGIGELQSWPLVASLSQRIWQYESAS
jgi:beta-lactamase class A